MVADDQMQMLAVDSAQAFECVLDGATVGEVAGESTVRRRARRSR